MESIKHLPLTKSFFSWSGISECITYSLKAVNECIFTMILVGSQCNYFQIVVIRSLPDSPSTIPALLYRSQNAEDNRL